MKKWTETKFHYLQEIPWCLVTITTFPLKYSSSQLRMQGVHLELAALIYHQAGESLQKLQN